MVMELPQPSANYRVVVGPVTEESLNNRRMTISANDRLKRQMTFSGPHHEKIVCDDKATKKKTRVKI